MEPDDAVLDRSVSWAHALVQSHAGVSFPKPLLIIGDEEIGTRIPHDSGRCLARAMPEMMYDDAAGAIIVPDTHLPSAEEFNPSKCRYALLHELAHALTMSVNPDLKEGRVTPLLNGNIRLQRIGYTMHSFVEGIADCIAVDAARASDDAALRACADDVHDARTDYFVRWFEAYFAPHRRLRSAVDMCRRNGVQPLQHSIDMVAKSPSDPLSCALSILDNCPGIVAANNAHYAVGYNFARNVGVDPVVLMRKPPKSFGVLLYPNMYVR